MADPNGDRFRLNGPDGSDIWLRWSISSQAGDADVWPVPAGILGDLVLTDHAADGCPGLGAQLLDGLGGDGWHGDGFVRDDDLTELHLDRGQLVETVARFLG